MKTLIEKIDQRIADNEEKAQLAHDDHNSIDEGIRAITIVKGE